MRTGDHIVEKSTNNRPKILVSTVTEISGRDEG